jgi:hypothetical protein
MEVYSYSDNFLMKKEYKLLIDTRKFTNFDENPVSCTNSSKILIFEKKNNFKLR